MRESGLDKKIRMMAAIDNKERNKKIKELIRGGSVDELICEFGVTSELLRRLDPKTKQQIRERLQIPFNKGDVDRYVKERRELEIFDSWFVNKSAFADLFNYADKNIDVDGAHPIHPIDRVSALVL